jgi:hypothetical protein
MRREILFILFAICFTSGLTAQQRVVPSKPYVTLRSEPGFITINELTGGVGLSGTSAPFSKYFIGFTSVNGYQVNKNFLLGAGTGFTIYESGLLVPLFLDFRFVFNISQLAPYLYADGGLLLNFSDLNSTKLFINPGFGVRYTVTRFFAFNFGAGIFSQVDATVRETFVNLKVGVVYKF